ncbi:MAG: hypothetical protein H6529_05900 [Nocardioides sp.]|nr:hypothetical protein [Nocardioidaceae bacterium]MCB8956000.1 hypothetical protein [Nocardioides sp.]
MTSSRLPGLLVTLLGTVALAVAVATLLAPDVLRGPEAMDGSAQGTALVLLVVGIPTYAVSAVWTRAGSFGAELVLTGVTAYLLYNAVMFVFATPFNRLFLLYVAMLGLALATLVHEVLEVWRRADRSMAVPPRWVAVYVLVVVALNALAWLARVVPAVLGDDPASLLDGTGVATNPVYVQDLAFWLPVMAWLGIGTWQGHAPRAALATAGIVMWVLESVGVAVDQWWAHAADPASPVASSAAVPLFLAVAAVALVPAVVSVRRSR